MTLLGAQSDSRGSKPSDRSLPLLHHQWTQWQLGIRPITPLDQCWVPLVIVLYDRQGQLRALSPQGALSGALTLDSQGVSRPPQGHTIHTLFYVWTLEVRKLKSWSVLGPPIVALYDQQGQLRAYSPPGSSIRSPHLGPMG